jgi:hypothetical protein
MQINDERYIPLKNVLALVQTFTTGVQFRIEDNQLWVDMGDDADDGLPPRHCTQCGHRVYEVEGYDGYSCIQTGCVRNVGVPEPPKDFAEPDPDALHGAEIRADRGC